MIRIESASVAYGNGAGRIVALNQVSATFLKGQVTAVVGPSGSGKSTLLAVVAGLKRTDSGSVWFDDRRLNDLSHEELASLRRARCGLIFQDLRLFRHLSVSLNLLVAAQIAHVDPSERKVAVLRVLESVGLERSAERRLNELSGGQRQRVAVARALLRAPSVLLADEPTAALDTANVTSCVHLFQAIARDRQCAVIVVTHDARVSERSDVVWRLEDGRLSNRTV